MIPALLAGTAVVGLASGLWQYLNSAKAQKANQQEIDYIKDLYAKVQDPQFDASEIMPEQIQILQKYVPETIPYLQEIAPQQVQAASAGALAGRQAQMNALAQYKRLMEQGYDPQTAIEMARAQRSMSAENAAARQTAQEQAARRGFGGGPSFYQAGTQHAGMDRLAQMQQQALSDAANRRMQATGAYAGLGGQIRGEDVNLEQANVNAINAFNQRNAANMRNWMQGQADIRNKGQMYNIGEGQRVNEANIANRYAGRTRNQELKNQLAQNKFSNQISRLGGMTGLSQQQMSQNLASAEQRNRAIQAGTDIATKAGMYAYEPEDKMKKG